MYNFASKALRVMIGATLLIAAFVALTPQPTISEAQDAQTPAALCASADITEPANRRYSEPEFVLEAGVDYHAIFCTGNGPVYVDLFEGYTPVTVNNFIFLAEAGYYNNSTFHRVIADFMAQGGDPVGNPPGTGGPGYQFQDEFVPFLAFDRPGLLAMANAGPATNGSQFFITRVPTPHLNQRHTIFGEVLQGQNVIDSMTDTENGDPESLDTVLIIEDPALVNSDYEAPAPATADETLTAVEFIFANEVSLSSDDASTFTSVEDAVARFDAGQSTASDLYEQYGFNFEAGGLWELSDCSADTSLLGVGYRMINWESTDAALGFVRDDALVTLHQEEGFEQVSDNGGVLSLSGFNSDAIFSRSVSGVCDADGTYVRLIWPAERFTIELDVIINNTIFESGPLNPEDIPAVMVNFAYQLTGPVGEVILNSDN